MITSFGLQAEKGRALLIMSVFIFIHSFAKSQWGRQARGHPSASDPSAGLRARHLKKRLQAQLQVRQLVFFPRFFSRTRSVVSIARPVQAGRGSERRHRAHAAPLAQESERVAQGEAALNQLFQKIYSDASDDVKKAMNKSFVSTWICLSVFKL